MLVVTAGSHLHNNSYVWMYAALTNLPCWIVLYSLWKKVARSRAAARRVKSDWSSQDAPHQWLGDGEVRRWNSDAESLLDPPETPKELQARRIAEWLKIPDRPRLRLRTRQYAELQSDSSLGTWQERLEGREIIVLA